MYCRNCGKELPSDSNFCPNCGARQGGDRVVNIFWFTEFANKHKKLLYSYFVWLFIHLALYLSSSKENPDGFYPCNKPISFLFHNWDYWSISWLDKYNVYDSSELFFYVILFPSAIYGLIKCKPYIVAIYDGMLQKMSTIFNQWKSNNSYQPTTTHDEDCESQIGETEMSGNDVVPLPIFRRFVGSLIDKILILISFVFGFFCVNPFGAARTLGRFTAMMAKDPSHYMNIDIGHLVEQGHSGQEAISRVEYMYDINLWAGVRGLDLQIVIAFILLNCFYYFLGELVCKASLGKRILGGHLTNIDSYTDINSGKCLVRTLVGGVLMVAAVFLHFILDISYLLTVPLFFLLIDISVFFNKASLIDLISGTIYLTRKNKSIK